MTESEVTKGVDEILASMHHMSIAVANSDERYRNKAKQALYQLLASEAENTGNGFLIVRLSVIKEVFGVKE